MIELPPPKPWELAGHLKFFHGVYVDDVLRWKNKRKKQAELMACHAWAHGEGGKVSIPHRHVI